MTPQEEGLVARLADEYKILQDKIDKIGGFRFTIKGWSITVIIGALFAVTTTKTIFSTSLWVGSLLILIGSFFYFEMEQTRLRQRFVQRTIVIEQVISRILRRDARSAGSNDFAILYFAPGIAHHLGPEHPHRTRHHQPYWRRLRAALRVCHDADIEFYLVLAALVCTVVWGQPKGQASADVIIKAPAQVTIQPQRDCGAKPSQPNATDSICNASGGSGTGSSSEKQASTTKHDETKTDKTK